MRSGELNSAAALGHTFRLVRANAVGVAAAVVLLAAVGTAADQLPALATPLTLVSVGLSIAFQDRLTSSALRLAGQEGHPGSRFGGVFFVSLLGNLGIILGLLLLVVPGIYLFARWSLAIPVLIEENRGPGEALRASWERTAGHVSPILVTLLPIYLPMLAGFAVAVAFGVAEFPEPAISLLLNLSIQACLVVGWHAAVAIYVALSTDGRIAEVFG